MEELNKSIEHITEQIEELFEKATIKELKRIYHEAEALGAIELELDNRIQFIKDNSLLIVKEGGEIQKPELAQNEDKDYLFRCKVTPIKVKVYKML